MKNVKISSADGVCRKEQEKMKKRKIQIEIIQQGEPRRKEILDFWAVQIGEQLKKEVPSKEERIEILEQILKKF